MQKRKTKSLAAGLVAQRKRAQKARKLQVAVMRGPQPGSLEFGVMERPGPRGRRAFAREYAEPRSVGDGGLVTGGPPPRQGFIDTMRGVIPKGAFSSLGAGVGSYFGPGGAAIGGAAGALLSKITGMGSYQIGAPPNLRRNSFAGRGMQIPRMSNDGVTDSVMVTQREFLGDVVSSATVGAFNLQSFILNPGEVGTHPWLSQLAALFEEYDYKGMVIEFKTTSGPIGNLGGGGSTALGSVVMATRYNAYDPDFANKQEMENAEYSISVVPSASALHFVECSPSQTPDAQKYIRTGATIPPGDLRLYDLGKFQIATVGCPFASNVLGELWISSQVEFRKKKIAAAGGGAAAVQSSIGTFTGAGGGAILAATVSITNRGGLVLTRTSNTTFDVAGAIIGNRYLVSCYGSTSGLNSVTADLATNVGMVATAGATAVAGTVSPAGITSDSLSVEGNGAFDATATTMSFNLEPGLRGLAYAWNNGVGPVVLQVASM